MSPDHLKAHVLYFGVFPTLRNIKFILTRSLDIPLLLTHNDLTFSRYSFIIRCNCSPLLFFTSVETGWDEVSRRGLVLRLITLCLNLVGSEFDLLKGTLVVFKSTGGVEGFDWVDIRCQ